MIYEVRHLTSYTYDAPVTASFGELHQLPGDADGQICLDRWIRVEPAPEYFRERRDWFGNYSAMFNIREHHEELLVVSTSVVDTSGRPDHGVDAVDRPAAGRPWDEVAGWGGDLSVAEMALDSPLVTRSHRLADYARSSFPPGRPVGDAVAELTHRIHADFSFDPEATTVDTPLERIMEIRRGVCQDFAHVLIGCLRSLGLAATYVSGYLETDPPPGGERLTGADRTHAWVAVHLGGGLWLGVDPTNDQIAGARYVTTAKGRDYADIPPLKGVVYTDAAESTLTVEVDVVPAAAGAGGH